MSREFRSIENFGSQEKVGADSIKFVDLLIQTILQNDKEFYKQNNEKVEAVRQEMINIRDRNIENGNLIYGKNGEFLHAVSPNGSTSNLDEQTWILSRTQNFKDWFGDFEVDEQSQQGSVSKGIDENGEPEVFYHASKSDSIQVFESEKEWTAQFKQRESSRFKVVSTEFSKGVYFTKNRTFIDKFAEHNPVKRIYEVFLQAVNPKKEEGIVNSNKITIEYVNNLQTQGFDSVLTDEGGIGNSIIVFESEQIKSVNNILFSPDEKNIYR